jgi:uncharacterized protein YraI
MKRIIYSIAALVLCAPLCAQAMEGWVIDDISLQAGPDPDYPSITELSAGTPVMIEGCIDGWTWCDVEVGADRGWVPGTFLEEYFGGEPVVLIDYGPRIGIPVVTFSVNVYWDKYYHSRPFYTQRETFVSRSIQPRAPQRPSATAVARAKTMAPAGTAHQQSKMQSATTAQQSKTQSRAMTTRQEQQQQTPTKQTARVTTPPHRPESAPVPKQPESMPAPKPESQPMAKSKDESAQQSTVAKAKPRTGEPKPKDELNKGKTTKPQKDEERDHGG